MPQTAAESVRKYDEKAARVRQAHSERMISENFEMEKRRDST
jgi:hypothetical protein